MSKFQNLNLDRLHQLINVNLTVTENYDNFEVVLQRLLHAIEMITNCEVTSFLLYDNETKNLTFRLASGKNTHELLGLVVPNGRGIAHTAIRDKKGMIINDMDEVKDKHYTEIDKILNFKTINLMAFPMLDHNGEVIGVVEACNKKNNENFTNEDYQILLIFCQTAERALRHTIKIANLRKKLDFANRKLTDLSHPSFVYGSKESETKLTFAKKIADSQSRVLIYGERGTGKTNLATQIHRFSNRNDKPIEYINCVDLSLLKNEQEQYIHIFGAKKNTKLGIRNDIQGIFELATGGTVILQEIGYLPLFIQEKVMLLIKFGHITPYGSDSNKSVNVRVLVTTSQKLEELVELHKFQEDLFYLLNSVNISISPLSARREDIVPITEYFFKKCVSESRKVITSIEPKVLYILKSYSWPNNVAELYNVIQRAVWNCDETTLRIHHIALHNFGSNDADGIKKKEPFVTLQDGINEFKKRYIYQVLLHNGWSYTKSAKVLKIQRSYLSKLVKMYNLKSGDEK